MIGHLNFFAVSGRISSTVDRKESQNGKNSFISFKIQNHAKAADTTLSQDFSIFITDKANVEYATGNLRQGDEVFLTGTLSRKEYQGKPIYSIVNGWGHTIAKLSGSSQSSNQASSSSFDDDLPY